MNIHTKKRIGKTEKWAKIDSSQKKKEQGKF